VTSLIRFFSIVLCACGLMTLAPAPASAQIEDPVDPGYQPPFITNGVVPRTASGALRADFKRGSKLVITEKLIPQTLCSYLDTNGGGTGSQSVHMALYRDQNGAPAQLVFETDQYSVTATTAPQAGWFCFLAPVVAIEPGTYWGMVHTGGNAGVLRYFYDTPANWYGNADAYADGSSASFGTGAAGDGTLALGMEYFHGTELKTAGRTSAGPHVSSPMTSQYKRASSVVLPEGGSLWALTVYVDGLGGSSGTQSLTLALYDDVNGEPGALVEKSAATFFTPIAGRTGRWVSAQLNPDKVVPAGRYWITLHTSGTAGVLRYYTEGTGNWRGNASPGTSPGPFFGPAPAGDGTISALVAYFPVGVYHGTFGRTTPGSVISKGYTADFIRGSSFTTPYLPTSTYMTALWAYLDGKGGATGSQKLKLATYVFNPTDPGYPVPPGAPMSKIVESDQVTINAGRAPGWVRFAIPYTRIYERPHYFMISSGANQGVVRNYHGNEANQWLGQTTIYANGAPSLLYPPGSSSGEPTLQQGAGSIAVYAEYVNWALQ